MTGHFDAGASAVTPFRAIHRLRRILSVPAIPVLALVLVELLQELDRWNAEVYGTQVVQKVGEAPRTAGLMRSDRRSRPQTTRVAGCRANFWGRYGQGRVGGPAR